MKIDVERVKRELKLLPFGAKGWLSNESIVCPNCGKSGKFGIKITQNSGGVNCFKCRYSDNFLNFLKSINRTDFVNFEYDYSIESKLEFIKEEVEEEVEELPEVNLPKGFKLIKFIDYLDSRGFKEYQYDKYGVGVTNHFLEKKLHEYIIFQIKQNKRLVGWLARSKRSKEWHKQNLQEYKQGESKLVLRYINSTGTNFSDIIGNYDDITENTRTVILVEGLFDCTNIENLLNLNDQEDVKCCFTFGNKISINQMKLLFKTNLERIILMYDPGTITQMKKYGLELSKRFEVMVAEIKDKEVDPGDISVNNLTEVFNNMKNILYFYNSRIDLSL